MESGFVIRTPYQSAAVKKSKEHVYAVENATPLCGKFVWYICGDSFSRSVYLIMHCDREKERK